eukprot:66924-Pelagomonas_calceolata.AAC.11
MQSVRQAVAAANDHQKEKEREARASSAFKEEWCKDKDKDKVTEGLLPEKMRWSNVQSLSTSCQ